MELRVKMAHSIKNPQIKHVTMLQQRGNGDLDDVYICNHSCSITESKVVFQKKDVTCKNCLKQLKGKQVCAQCGCIVPEEEAVLIVPSEKGNTLVDEWLKYVKSGDYVCSECIIK